MRRLFGILAMALVVLVPVYASAQASTQAAKPAAKPAAKAGKIMTATGSVTTVTADSMTVKAKSGEMTFAVDSKVKVTGTGASTKTRELKAANKTPALTDYLKTGDMVSVTYTETDGTKHASAVRVMSATK